MYANAIYSGLLFALLWSLPAHAQELPPCGEPIAQNRKPVLSDYQDYNRFVVDVMAHSQNSHRRQAHARACPEDYQPPASAAAQQSESLQAAMQDAQQREPLDYQQHPTWHNRSTSRSFALPPLPGNTLADQSIRTLLANIGTDNPNVFPLSQLAFQLGGINNGLSAAQLTNLFRFNDLPQTERDALFASMIANNPRLLADIMQMGNLTFYFDINQDIITTDALIVVQSCLSSGCPDQ